MLNRTDAPLVHTIDRVYHWLAYWMREWVVKGIFTGTLFGILANYLIVGNSGYPMITHWIVYQFLVRHQDAVAIPITFCLIYTLLWMGHFFYLHPPMGDELPLEPLKRLDILQMHLDPRPDQYYPRQFYPTLCQSLQAQLWRKRLTTVLISGRAAIGKTRLLYELLRGDPLSGAFRNAWYLMVNEIPPTLTERQKQQIRTRHIVLIGDDVELHLDCITSLIQSLPTWQKARRLTIIMTCSKNALSHVTAVAQPLLAAGGESVMLEPMQPNTAEWIDFLAWAQTAFPADEVHEAHFDGTPGSLIFDLQQRTEELRHASPAVFAILHTCLILHNMAISPWTDERIKRVATGIFQLSPHDIPPALQWLVHENWLVPDKDAVTMVAEVLFECLTDVDQNRYPAVGRTVYDDIPQLIDLFADAPMDEQALISIGERIRQMQRVGEGHRVPVGVDAATILERALTSPTILPQSQAEAQLQVRCATAYIKEAHPEQAIPLLEAAQHTFNRHIHPLNWAAATIQLGAAHQAIQDAQRSEHIETAIELYEASITVYQQETHPFEWADTSVALADLYDERQEGSRIENIDRGIHTLVGATAVYTRRDYPKKWASIQTKLAHFYRERIRGLQWRNRERSRQSLQQAVAILSQQHDEDGRLEHGRALVNLGYAYHERVLGSPRFNQGKALEHLQQAIALYDEFPHSQNRDLNLRLGWARAHTVLGIVYRALPFNDREANQLRAVTAMKAALQELDPERSRRLWVWTTLELGRTYQDPQYVYDCLIHLATETFKTDPRTEIYWVEAVMMLAIILLRLATIASEEQQNTQWNAYRKRGRLLLNEVEVWYERKGDQKGLMACQELLRRYSSLLYAPAA